MFHALACTQASCDGGRKLREQLKKRQSCSTHSRGAFQISEDTLSYFKQLNLLKAAINSLITLPTEMYFSSEGVLHSGHEEGCFASLLSDNVSWRVLIDPRPVTFNCYGVGGIKHAWEISIPGYPTSKTFISQGETAVSMNVKSAWLAGYTGQRALVAVVDDGVKKDHPDLVQSFVSFQLSLFIAIFNWIRTHKRLRWENTSPCPMIIFFNLF